MTRLLLAGALAALAALLLLPALPRPVARPPETVTIALVSLPQSGMVYLARELDYFAEEGVEVRLDEFPSGKLALQSMLNGNADFAVSAETPLAIAAVEGRNPCALGMIAYSDDQVAVIGRPDRGLRAIGDLRGRRVAVTAGTNGEYFLDSMLLLYGVARQEVQIRNTPPEEMVALLVTGEVDAVATWYPLSQEAATHLGSNAFIYRNDWLHQISFLISSTPQFAAARPEAARRVLAALRRALSYMRAEPAPAKALLARMLNAAPRAAPGEEAIRIDDFDLKLGQGLVESLVAQAEWYAARQGGARPLPDFSRHLCPGPLLAVDPRAVALPTGGMP